MPSAAHKKAALLLLAFSFLVRVWHLDLPLIEPYNNVTRQVVVGMVVRNFYLHGFNFFYPETDDNGAGPSLFNAEVPVYSYLMAIGYKLAGGVKEWAARLVSVFFSMGTLIFLYLWVRRLFSPRAALFAVFFAAFSPMNAALSRSVQPDALMLFASVAGLYFFYRYCETGSLKFCVWSGAFLALAVATKAYTLYLFIPIAFMALQKYGAAAFKQPRNYLFTAAVCSVLLWYVYMWQLGKSLNLSYVTITYSQGRGIGYKTVWDIFSRPYLLKTFKIFFFHVLTPAGAICLVLGLASLWRKREARFLYAWLFSIVFFLLVFWRAAIDHPYYQLPFIAAGAFFMGVGAEKIWGKGIFGKAAAVILLASTLFGFAHYAKGLYFIPKELESIVEAGEAVKESTPQDSVVLASYGSNPSLLYYCQRKGWTLDIQNSPDVELISKLESYKKKGASFYAAVKPRQLDNRLGFNEYLRTNYKPLQETERFVIFDLRQSLA